MAPNAPKSIKIEGDLWPDDTETLTGTDNLRMISEENTTEIFVETEEARSRVLALLEKNKYAILER